MFNSLNKLLLILLVLGQFWLLLFSITNNLLPFSFKRPAFLNIDAFDSVRSTNHEFIFLCLLDYIYDSFAFSFLFLKVFLRLPELVWLFGWIIRHGFIPDDNFSSFVTLLLRVAIHRFKHGVTVKFGVHIGRICAISPSRCLFMDHFLHIGQFKLTPLLSCLLYYLFCICGVSRRRFMQILRRILGRILSWGLLRIVATEFIDSHFVHIQIFSFGWKTHLFVAIVHYENVRIQFVWRLVCGRGLDPKITRIPFAIWMLHFWLESIVHHWKHWIFLVAQGASFRAIVLRNDFLVIFLWNI